MLPSAFPKPRQSLLLQPAVAEAIASSDALSNLAALSRRMGISDSSVLVDDESPREPFVAPTPCWEVTKVDLRFFDPGPLPDEVPFGFTCGSCVKFVHWSDPRRRDPLFMASVSQREHCPRLTLHEQPIPVTIPLEEFIPQADHAGCDAFALDIERAPASVANALEPLDALSFEELAVVGFEVQRAYLGKKHGERYGYLLGDEFTVRKAGRPITVRVIGFQRKSGEEVIVTNVHDLSQVFTVPALRAK